MVSQDKTTVRALIEHGLRQVLAERKRTRAFHLQKEVFMIRNIKIAMACLLIGLMPVLLSGCGATQAAKTGFLKDYSKLTPHPDIDGRHVYLNPNMNIRDYSKFIVDPVVLSLSKTGKERGVDQEDLNEQVTFFHQQIVHNLEQGYRVVSSPGKGVARVRVAITDVEKTNPFLNIHPGTKLTGAGLGSAGMEAEIVDSVTGQTIAAAIDNQKGSRLSLTAGLKWFGHAQAVMENWAEDLKKFIDKGHGKTSKKM